MNISTIAYTNVCQGLIRLQFHSYLSRAYPFRSQNGYVTADAAVESIINESSVYK